MRITRTMYSDPAHGWLKVPFSDLTSLGIEEKISSFSYMHEDKFHDLWIYLEEDEDFSTYYKALKDREISLNVKESISNHSSRIRNYNDYDLNIIKLMIEGR